MKTIDAAKFKEQCLRLLDKLPAEGIIITKLNAANQLHA
jgi:hypothetical protein